MSTPRRAPTLGALLAGEDRFYVPAALVAQKAKSVFDGIFAAVEGISTDGDELGMGVRAFLATLGTRLPPATPARGFVDAAIDLAEGRSVPGGLDPVRAKVLGFYTWNEALERVFRRDRYLQQKLEDTQAESLAAVIGADPALQAAYVRHVRRIARMTNPLVRDTLEVRMGMHPPNPFSDGQAVFPGSSAPENRFKSVDAFFSAVKCGTCDLTPNADSGFYAHQLYALTALLLPRAMREAKHRTIDDEYAAALDLFAAANLFFARESHVKQLQIPIPVMPVPRREPVHWILPGLTIEPVPTFYGRTADAFRFLRTVVEEGWGPKAFEARQLRESGPVSRTIGEGIDEVISLCDAARDLSFRELEGAGASAEADGWRAPLRALSDDPDVTSDARGMVPMGMTGNGDVRVLVFAGWELHKLVVKLTHVAHLPAGAALGAESHPLPVPMVRETVVAPGDLLNRNEVRALCDRVLGDPEQAPALAKRLAGSRRQLSPVR